MTLGEKKSSKRKEKKERHFRRCGVLFKMKRIVDGIFQEVRAMRAAQLQVCAQGSAARAQTYGACSSWETKEYTQLQVIWWGRNIRM